MKSREDILSQLVSRIDTLLAEYSKLRDRTEFLEQQTSLLREQNHALKDEVEQIKNAQSIMLTDSDVHATKRQINQMIQEIDRCIALLNVGDDEGD